MTIRIVTDSTCDLPREVLQELDIRVIPLSIHVGLNTYLDGIDLSRRDFYEQMPDFSPTATTAAPGPEVFRKAYEEYVHAGASKILSIHISSKLSAIVDIARQAAAEIKTIPVTVFDSRQLSLGMGFLVLTAARAADQGRSVEEILPQLEDQIRRTHVMAALDTLEFLRRSGRMSVALSALGTLLRIKPLLKMFNGNPTAERVRTREGAMRRLKEYLDNLAPLEKFALLHSRAASRAEQFLQEIRHLLPEGKIMIEEINPVLGVHIGPGVVGFACVTK